MASVFLQTKFVRKREDRGVILLPFLDRKLVARIVTMVTSDPLKWVCKMEKSYIAAPVRQKPEDD